MKTFWIDSNLMREFEAENTDVYRLGTANEAWIERFGPDLLVSFKNEAARDRLLTEYFLWAESVRFRFSRIFGRLLPRYNEDREAPRLLLGKTGTSLNGVVTERHLRYGIDFSAGYSVGLFPDQRENRSFVRRIAPKRLLNCFAYTCSFSVAAATAGANTVNIDLSRKSLARGRENFALNNISDAGHQFIADDVLEVLPRLARKSEVFDTIVLDPPTFSRAGRGRTFQVEADFERLLSTALELAARETRILLSTNCAKLDARALEVMARFCLKTARRAGVLQRLPPPPDFASAAPASSVWLTLR